MRFTLKYTGSEISCFFNILKVQYFKDTIPKFETCLKKIGDFIRARKLCGVALKNGLRIARPKCPVTLPETVVLWTRGQDCDTIRRVLAIHNISLLYI